MYLCHRFFILNVYSLVVIDQNIYIQTCLHDVANTCKIQQYIWTDYRIEGLYYFETY